MNKTLITVSVIAVAALIVAGLALVRPVNVKVETSELGALSGPNILTPTFFNKGLVYGGKRATSTNDTTATFLYTDMDDESLIEFTPNVAGITATLPATSTIANLRNAGDSRNLMICNATSTASTPFTLAVGTGMNLQQATSTLTIATGQCAFMTFVRASDTDIEVYYDLGF
jgi:hypothetical protein